MRVPRPCMPPRRAAPAPARRPQTPTRCPPYPAQVAEPSRCEYTAELATPVACSGAHLAQLKKQLAEQRRLQGAGDGAAHEEL